MATFPISSYGGGYAFSRFSPGPPPFALGGGGSVRLSCPTPVDSPASEPPAKDTTLAVAAFDQTEKQQQRKEKRHQLNTRQMPLCLGLGFMIYALGGMLNPNARIIRNMDELLNRNRQLRADLDTLNTRLIRENANAIRGLRLPLTQLRTMLEASDVRPTQMYGYMDQIRTLASHGDPHLSRLLERLDAYKGTLKRVMNDTQGLELLAQEPRLLRRMGLSEYKAREMARNKPEELIGKLFRDGFSAQHLNQLSTIFNQLGERQRLIVRLAAFTIPGILYGYFFSKTMMDDLNANP